MEVVKVMLGKWGTPLHDCMFDRGRVIAFEQHSNKKRVNVYAAVVFCFLYFVSF